MYVDACGKIETGKISGSKDESEQLGERLALRLKGESVQHMAFTHAH
jgi:4-hydroxyphenylpyruvate dioxygenase-like putative hemolysin